MEEAQFEVMMSIRDEVVNFIRKKLAATNSKC